MKHDPKTTANALTVVGSGLYVICVAWTSFSRNSFMGVMNTWTHGIELSALPSKTPDFGSLTIGLITFAAATWLTGYAFAVVYNKLVQNR